MATPTIPSTLYDRPYFPRKRMKNIDNTETDFENMKVTIITDANVDQHELDIPERRIQRKNIMDLTARGVIDPTKPKAKLLR